MARYLIILSVFLVTTLAIVALSMLLTKSSLDNSLLAVSIRIYLVPAVIVAQIVAVVLTLVRVYLRSVSKAGVLVVLFVLNALITIGTIALAPADLVPLDVPRIPENVWLRGESLQLYVESRQGLSVSGAIVNRFADRPRMTHYDRGLVDPQGESLVIPATGESVALSSLLRFVYEPFRPPEGVRSIGSDSVALANRFKQRWEDPPRLDTSRAGRVISVIGRYVWPVAWALVLVSLWATVRATRWPLFNVLFTAVIARGLLLLPGIVDHPVVTGHVMRIAGDAVYSLAVPILWSAIAVLFLTVAALMPPLQRKPATPKGRRRGDES